MVLYQHSPRGCELGDRSPSLPSLRVQKQPAVGESLYVLPLALRHVLIVKVHLYLDHPTTGGFWKPLSQQATSESTGS